MRLQSVILTNEGVQIMYVEESDNHSESGVMEARALDIPHEVLPQVLLDDLVEAAQAIVEEARVLRRQPLQQFKAPR